MTGIAFSDYYEKRKTAAWFNTARCAASECFDCDGRLIKWVEYGELSEFGWEVDHATPTGIGGLDVFSNLRARHWRGNRSAGGILGSLLDK